MLPHRRCVINHPKPDTILEPLQNQVLLFGLLLVIISAFIGGIDGLGDVILLARTEQALVGEGIVAGFNVAVIGLTADQLITNYARERKTQLGIE